MEQITSFRGDYFFLSNFYEANVEYNGHTYLCNESAFQAQKTLGSRYDFTYMFGKEAKLAGRRVELRSDWEQAKDKIMLEVCTAKFEQNPDLRELLQKTGDVELIEGNTWHDTYWGVCNGSGLNKLGKILMSVRATLRDKYYS
jgi:ribA/ribD-fused uncharacterized protein